MVQMGLSQCLSDREFPEFFKTLLTFDPIGSLRGVMGNYVSFKKRQGLLSEAVCVEGQCSSTWGILDVLGQKEG